MNGLVCTTKEFGFFSPGDGEGLSQEGNQPNLN